MPRGARVCDVCESKPIRIMEPRCKKCSKPLLSAEQEFCYDCSVKDFHYERGYSLWIYDGLMQKSMIDFKYNGRKEYAAYYANEIARHFTKEIRSIGPDVIMPIPVHSTRRRQRGYNQAELLALELGRQLHILVRSDVLIRTVKTRPQKELSNIERMKNLEKAFAVNGLYRDECRKYHKILLVDDIYTTGSTIEACSKILLQAGAGEIYYVTLCIGQGY